MKYIVTTDTAHISGGQIARLYRRVLGHKYQLAAQGTFAEMNSLAEELNQGEHA